MENNWAQQQVRLYFENRLLTLAEDNDTGEYFTDAGQTVSDVFENMVDDLGILTTYCRESAKKFMRTVDVLQNEYLCFYAFLETEIGIQDLPPQAVITESNFTLECADLQQASPMLQSHGLTYTAFCDAIQAVLDHSLNRIYLEMNRLLSSALLHHFEALIPDPTDPQPEEIDAFKAVHDQLWDAITQDGMIAKEWITSSDPEVFNLLESFVNYTE